MGEKVTTMVLKVDLWCSKCCKKVKKVLRKFPQIQDQLFDEKTNTVKIKVVSCSPEKIRDKLHCKGEGSIKSIEILEPASRPKPPQDGHNPKPTPPQDGHNPKPTPPKPTPQQDGHNPKPTSPEDLKPPLLPLVPVPCYPPVCSNQCFEGHWGGPPYQLSCGQERDYDWCYARLVYESWGGSCNNRVYCRGRCSDCTCGSCSDCTCGSCSNCTCGRCSDCTCGRCSTCTCGRCSDCTRSRCSDCTCGRCSDCTRRRCSTCTCGRCSDCTCKENPACTIS